MLDTIVNSAVNFLVPTILSAIIASFSVGGVMWKRLTNNSRQDDMLLALGRYRLVSECEIILSQGYITTTQYEMLTALYKAYHGLGGNSVGTALYERAIKLKIEEVDHTDDGCN